MSFVTINLPFDNLVKVIKNLSLKEKKQLYKILDDEILFNNDTDLKKRMKDINKNPDIFVSENEIFSNLS